jgi:class 3 adenylate cyclase/tetratricopeptide (TPR) repeat protein
MAACPSCGHNNRDGAKFCEECASPLVTSARPAAEERKVVTCLFCDLVGFTAKAEQLDPEEVRAVLRPYHDRVRSELERHGGTVEKFIGDAVMALFGAPTAHEDDPERAVRAALAVREFAVEEQLELRIGITTGEALVSLGASASVGEGMASGDVVNTAARLQSAAPVNGILVDETTYRATRAAIEFADAPAVEAKGKAEPIPVWVATEAHSRFGIDVTHHARAALVGREQELGVLRDAFLRARSSRTPQLVTLVGVPGIGKSRLVFELRKIVDADPELVTWRQGRCLAYGEGVAFWALAEVVKAQAGIHEQDGAQEAERKLWAAVNAVIRDGADSRWVEAHLRPLVGLDADTGLGGDRHGEAFAAWRRFLEALAEERSLVLVLEDLHWADDGLLDFIDALLDWLSDVPLLVVCSARPELLERRPGWGGGKLNVSTIGLSPLSNGETAGLISQILERYVLPAEAQQALLEQADGNPLYAEQFAELYLERGSTEELPLPETLQGIIAARLDGLPSKEKVVLHDAAVVGKVFWTGAIGRDAKGTDALLHSLARKGFLARQRRSSVEGEGEWAFAHMLLRDVAYGQIPRPERAQKHQTTAQWIESLGRPEDHAELLAFHWRSALELTRASGRDSGQLERPARLAFRAAAERAFSVHAYPAAAAYFDEALALWPRNDPDRPPLMFRRAQALLIAGDERRIEALEQARDDLLAMGDVDGAAEAEAFLAQVAWFEGRHDDVADHLAAAQRLIGDDPGRSAAVTRVLAVSARYRSLAGEYEQGRALASKALALAEGLGQEELRAHALITIGTAKWWLGEDGGETDLESALAIARAANSRLAATALNNLAVLASTTDVRHEHALLIECVGAAERMGDRDSMGFSQGNLVHDLWLLGRWDEALEAADRLVSQWETGTHSAIESFVRIVRASLFLGRGEINAALADYERAREHARKAAEARLRREAQGVSACALLLLGRSEEARILGREFATALPDGPEHLQYRFALVSLYADDLGIASEMRRVAEAAFPGRFRDAALAALEGDFLEAAHVFEAVGAPTGEAEARLRAAQTSIASGRRFDGEAELEKALSFYRSVRATFFIERGERLLDTAQSESA